MGEFQRKNDSIDEENTRAYLVDSRAANDNRRASGSTVVIADIESKEYKDTPTFIWTDDPDATYKASISLLVPEDRVQKTFAVNRGKVTVSVETFESQFKSSNLTKSSKNNVSTSSNNNLDPGGGGGGNSCIYLQEHCTDVRWTCVIDILLVYGSCAAAVVPILQKAAALLCIAQIGNTMYQAMNDIGCSICTNTDVRALNVCDDGWDISPP